MIEIKENNMAKKYKLEKCKPGDPFYESGLYRIIALKDIGKNVKKGDRGGLVASKENLSQTGNCWIFDDARVYHNARVEDNAIVEDNAEVYLNAIIKDNACIYHNASISGNSIVGGNTIIDGWAYIAGDFINIDGNVYILDKAKIMGSVSIAGDVGIFGNSIIEGGYDKKTAYGIVIDSRKDNNSIIINTNKQILGYANIFDNTRIFDDTSIYAKKRITLDKNTILFSNAYIESSNHFGQIHIGSDKCSDLIYVRNRDDAMRIYELRSINSVPDERYIKTLKEFAFYNNIKNKKLVKILSSICKNWQKMKYKPHDPFFPYENDFSFIWKL